MTWPQLADGKGSDGAIPAAYRIQGTPELPFVLDRAGQIFSEAGIRGADIDAAVLKEAPAQPLPR